MTGMTLASIIAITTQVSLGTRRTAADDATSARLLMAAESGLAGFLDRTRRAGVGYSGANNSASMNTVLAQMIDGSPMNSFSVPGATVSIKVNKTIPATFASLNDLNAIDVTSTATSGSDRSSVTQRFTVKRGNLPKLNIPGALTSYPGVNLNGNASIGGATIDAPDRAVFASYLNLKRRDAQSTVKGVPLVMDATGSLLPRLKALQPGSYVRLPLADASGAVLPGAPTGLFRVDATDSAAQTVTLTPTSLPSGVLTPFLPTSVPADLVRNALIAVSASSLIIQNSETFIQGDTVSIRLGTETYTAKVSSTPVNTSAGTTFSVGSWAPGTPTAAALLTFSEGQPVSKSTLGVVTARSFSRGKTDPVGGVMENASAAVVPSPLNDTLFTQTFGMSPDSLQALSTVVTEAQFSANSKAIDGLTWLTSSDHSLNLNNEKITGKGILIVDGDLTVNQNQSGACDMNGVLYVRGNLRIQGNLQLCGAIVVEGSVLNNDNEVISIDYSDTALAGTGRKIQYDPNVLYDVTQGTGKVAFSSLVGSWRQQ
ncbi:hypothetical protein [Deinococcus koreensis]|nr:hypothetical protein [Deinococcus koreensis]